MPRANIAASLDFRTKGRAKLDSVAARNSEDAAERHAEPEGTANTSSGTGLTRAKAVCGQHHQQAAVAHGREEEQSIPLRHHRAAPTWERIRSPYSWPPNLPNTTRFVGSQAPVASWPAPCLHVQSHSPHSQACAPSPAWPNPSLKRSANGRPPAPGRWYAVQFHRPVAGVPPSSPA